MRGQSIREIIWKLWSKNKGENKNQRKSPASGAENGPCRLNVFTVNNTVHANWLLQTLQLLSGCPKSLHLSPRLSLLCGISHRREVVSAVVWRVSDSPVKPNIRRCFLTASSPDDCLGQVDSRACLSGRKMIDEVLWRRGKHEGNEERNGPGERQRQFSFKNWIVFTWELVDSHF